MRTLSSSSSSIAAPPFDAALAREKERVSRKLEERESFREKEREKERERRGERPLSAYSLCPPSLPIRGNAQSVCFDSALLPIGAFLSSPSFCAYSDFFAEKFRRREREERVKGREDGEGERESGRRAGVLPLQSKSLSSLVSPSPSSSLPSPAPSSSRSPSSSSCVVSPPSPSTAPTTSPSLSPSVPPPPRSRLSKLAGFQEFETKCHTRHPKSEVSQVFMRCKLHNQMVNMPPQNRREKDGKCERSPFDLFRVVTEEISSQKSANLGDLDHETERLIANCDEWIAANSDYVFVSTSPCQVFLPSPFSLFSFLFSSSAECA